VRPVELLRLERQQVHRDRVGTEGVHDQHIVVPAPGLLEFARERDAPVTDDHLDARPGGLEKRKVALGEVLHGRVELVEAVAEALVAVYRERPRAEPDNAHPHIGSRFLQTREQPADAGVLGVVTGRRQSPLRFQQLEAVHRRAVDQHAARRRGGRLLADVQQPVKIAHARDLLLRRQRTEHRDDGGK